MEHMDRHRAIEAIPLEGQRSGIRLGNPGGWKFLVQATEHVAGQVTADQVHSHLDQGNADATRAGSHLEETNLRSHEVHEGLQAFVGDRFGQGTCLIVKARGAVKRTAGRHNWILQ
jgi:hypothetical protein